MAATYDPVLPTDRDWVRYLSGDTDVSDPQLQDQEIEALLGEEANKYLAAARAAEVVLVKGGSSGVVSKAVGDLSITYGGTAEEAFKDHISKLRERGCELLLKRSGSHVFRVL